MNNCKAGASYLVQIKTGKDSKEHYFSCGKHLGEIVRIAIEWAHKCKVKVSYCPAPGDQPCQYGVAK